MNIINYFRFRSNLTISFLCTLTVGCTLMSHNSNAQEILRLPNFTLKQVQPAVDKGSPESFYILATLYYKGLNGVGLNYQKSAELFRRAAEQGIALAQLHLGEMYYEGTKIPQNDSEALRWYQVAALQGLPQAEYGLANIYAEGHGTTRNLTEAARWYKRAAIQGYGLAQHQTGINYANGTGVNIDPVNAYKWLSLASSKGVMESIGSRDDMRKSMTKDQLATAQRNASMFTSLPHYNTNELKCQKTKIIDLAKEIKKNNK